MDTKWTLEQLDAINVKNRAAIVSAAAGSGKTAVLVEKLLRLLTDKSDPVPADRMIVVTFTNDAAAQMRQRLSAGLSEMAEREPDNELLIRQQALLPSAKISTIHSFCFDLIRENASLIEGADSGFRVLDAPRNDIIAAKAADNVFGVWYEDKKEDMKKLTDFFCPGARDGSRLGSIVSELRESLLALDFPFEKMKRYIQRYKEPPEVENDELISGYTRYVLGKIKKAAQLYETVYENIKEIYGARGMEIPKIKKQLDAVEREYNGIISLCGRIGAKPSLLFEGAPELPFERIVFYSSDKPSGAEFDGEAIEREKKCRVKIKKTLEKYIGEFTYEDIRGDYLVHARICELLFSLVGDVLKEESRLKSEKNALGFSDAEQLACGLLCTCEDGVITKTPLAKELSDYYRIVMIDEFQDSTAVQELIFRMLSKDGCADRPGTDLFAVGDVKQSIYRFRRADPRIFTENIRKSVPYDGSDSDAPCHILLNRNFRSSRHVVDFVNAVFSNIMSEENGGIDYGGSEMLIEGAGLPDIFGPTEIINIPDLNAEGEEENSTVQDGDAEDSDENAALDLIEAKCVAARIRELLDSGVKISAREGERDIRPSDVCILMRNAKKAGVYIDCLEELGINAGGSATDSYLQSREISVLIDLLRCIDNPALDISLTAVLMSPMFMFTAEDMAYIRLGGGSSVYADINLAANGETNCPEELSRQCGEFLDIFGALREYAASRSTEELIGYIYDKTDFMSVVSVYSDSLKKKANLRLLPIYAADYDKNGTGDLGGFVRQINGMLDSSRDFAAASAAGDMRDAVSVKTIHSSKGLEYPFVFLCRTSTRFNKSDLNRQLVFTSEYGAAFRISDREKFAAYESFPRKAMSLIAEKALRDEEMMLLYVALTRARNKLFITRRTDKKSVKHRENICALCEKGSPKQDGAASDAVSMADWLDAAISLFEERGEVYALDGCEIVFSEGKTEVSRTGETVFAAPERNEAMIKEYHENMSGGYDLTASRTASKLTVSELAKHSIKRRQFIFSKEEGGLSSRPKGISAAAAGTAVHTFMQRADIKAIYRMKDEDEKEAKIKSELERLCLAGVFSEAEAKCVRPGAVIRFTEDEICKRMVNSGELMREKKFLVKISDLNLDDSDLLVYNNTEGMLQGIADCVFEENGKCILVDYKTDRGVTEDILRERYSRQLSLYAAALSAILGKPVTEGYLYSFELGRSVRTKI